MSFDLRITFTGMCLFVPDSRIPSDRRMHVLLPETTEHPHDARLLFDEAYASGASELTRTLQCRVLDRQTLRLQGLAGGATQGLPGEIVNLFTTLGNRVAPDKLSDLPPAVVKSRITLSAGAVTDYEVGARWDLPGHPARPMTWQVEWTIRGIDAATLEWQLISLDDGTLTEQLPPLRPLGGIVHVMVYHVITSELPGTNPPRAPQIPNPGDPVEHFPEYFALATGGANTVPTFSDLMSINTTCAAMDHEADAAAGAHHVAHGDAVAEARHAAHDDDAGTGGAAANPGRGGSPFTCMTATAPIG